MVHEVGFIPIDLSVWSIAVEKCDLCGYSKRPFYCKSCVNTGNFCYSPSLYHRPTGFLSESAMEIPYCVKHAQWVELKKEIEGLKKKLNHVHQVQNENNLKEVLIKQKKSKLESLKERLKHQESLQKKSFAECKRLKEQNQKIYENTVLAKAKITNIKDHTRKLHSRAEDAEKELSLSLAKLSKCRRNLVKAVIRDIFPISSSNSISDSVDQMMNSSHKTVNLLRDASRTTFIQGRWVSADSGWDQTYQVLTASLPGNGEYSKCWTDGGILETVKSPGELQASPTLNVIAGLSFLNQMVLIIALILDLRLPFHVPLKEFYRLDLSEKLFNRAVSRLNKNVATICFYQNVDRTKLHGLHTVVNILNLIKTPDLGWDLPQSPQKTKMEDRGGLFPVGDSMFACYDDDFYDENDEEEIPEPRTKTSSDKDWEYIPSGIPSYKESSGDQQSYISSAVAPASGVTSIVTSLWKAFGGTGDKK